MHDPPHTCTMTQYNRTIDSWCSLKKKKQQGIFTIALVIPYLTFKKYIIQSGIG